VKQEIIFGHGGDDPSAFYVRPKPEQGRSHPLMYGDQLVLAYTAEIGWTDYCGWYGCRVAQLLGAERKIRFGHGKSTPTAFWVRPKAGSGSDGCVKYGDQMVLAYTSESGRDEACGWYGCSVSNYKGQGQGTITFDNGKDGATAFYVRPKAGTFLEGCVEYGDQVVLTYTFHYDKNQCGWYGCRVANYDAVKQEIIFGHGRDDPSAFYVRPKP